MSDRVIPEWTFDQSVEAIAQIIGDNVPEETLSDKSCIDLAKLIAARLEKGP